MPSCIGFVDVVPSSVLQWPALVYRPQHEEAVDCEEPADFSFAVVGQSSHDCSERILVYAPFRGPYVHCQSSAFGEGDDLIDVGCRVS